MRFINLKTKCEETEIFSPYVLCLGNFDGVHLGHRLLINKTVEICNRLKNDCPDVKCGAWIFESPVYKSASLIFSTEQKLDAFSSLGLDYAFVADFEELRGLSPETFVNEVLRKECRCIYALCGENFRFGARAAANASCLVSLMDGNALALPLLTLDGAPVSSTLIREFLLNGKIEEANKMLGQNYYIEQPVLHGKALGRTVNIPTINQKPSDELFVLQSGIYATYCFVDGVRYMGVTNVGVRPTVENTSEKNIETHLIGYSGDCYEKTVRTEFIARIRDEIRFSSLEELTNQISLDVEHAKELLQNK